MGSLLALPSFTGITYPRQNKIITRSVFSNVNSLFITKLETANFAIDFQEQLREEES